MSEKTVIVGGLNEVSMISTFVTFDDDGSGYKMSDVIKVTLKTGDAPAETISWTVE